MSRTYKQIINYANCSDLAPGGVLLSAPAPVCRRPPGIEEFLARMPVAKLSIDEAEHPDGYGVAGGEFHVVFYQVADPGILDLPALLVFATYLKGNSVYFEIGDLGGCDFVNLGSPNHEVGLPHVAGVDDAVLGKGHGNIAVAQIEFLHLGEEVVAVTGFMEGVEESGGGQILDVVRYIVAADAEVTPQGFIAGLIGYALG